MPTELTPEARRTANRLLDVLQRRPVTAGATAPDPPIPGPRGADVGAALVERAKGAVMLHYGVDSHQASAVLLGWARMSHTSVPTIAHTLLRGICEGNPQTELRQRALTRWLETQLRDGDLERAQLPTAPVLRGPATKTPRSG